jgi:hypothetical protein
MQRLLSLEAGGLMSTAPHPSRLLLVRKLTRRLLGLLNGRLLLVLCFCVD